MKDKSGFGMICDKIQDNTAMNGVILLSTIFRLLFVKLRFQSSDLSDLTSYPSAD